MKPLELRITDPAEALAVEQVLALVRQLQQTCREAPDGQVLAYAEQVAVDRGRQLMRAALEAVLNQQAGDLEKKGLPGGHAPAAARASTRGGPPARS